jgi:rubrerythrin
VVNTASGPNIRSNKIETGTTEKGDTSNQQFASTNRNFYSYSFHNVAWRILPNSVKQYHKEELGVLYCGECGAKRKKDTHKFCPNCGTKF